MRCHCAQTQCVRIDWAHSDFASQPSKPVAVQLRHSQLCVERCRIGAFVLFYYKQVLGLSGTLTGLAIVFFAAKFITGFGYPVAGPFLDLTGLEAGTVPGEASRSLISASVLTWARHLPCSC